MSKLISLLRRVIDELDRVQPGGELDARQLDRDVLPTFRTAESGEERYFSTSALHDLDTIADSLYTEPPDLAPVLREHEFYLIVLQAAADCHASGEFDPPGIDEPDDCLSNLRDRARNSVGSQRTVFTHYFPAWTLGAETHEAFSVGPVTFLTRGQWIDSVRFPGGIEAAYNTSDDEWKRTLRGSNDDDSDGAKELANDVSRALSDCPSVLRVEVSGGELQLSRQRARFCCRTALDSLALILPRSSLHRQFVLSDERLSPLRQSNLTETEGQLWLPGASILPRGWDGDPEIVQDIANHGKKLLDSCGKVIDGMLHPSGHPAPDLAKRWAFALAWFGDGCREPHDAVAVTKLATSLDVLSSGGKNVGIRDMLVHLSGRSVDSVIVNSPQRTLAQVVKLVYDAGRSQILHGSHVDPMKSFVEMRGYATSLARVALRECVIRLSAYSGPDEPTAFRTMSPAPTN